MCPFEYNRLDLRPDNWEAMTAMFVVYFERVSSFMTINKLDQLDHLAMALKANTQWLTFTSVIGHFEKSTCSSIVRGARCPVATSFDIRTLYHEQPIMGSLESMLFARWRPCALVPFTHLGPGLQTLYRLTLCIY